jgi:hypothetical protein
VLFILILLTIYQIYHRVVCGLGVLLFIYLFYSFVLSLYIIVTNIGILFVVLLLKRNYFSFITESSAPENVSLVCRFDNISHTSFVYVTWTPPIQPNGQIMHYNVSKHDSCILFLFIPLRRAEKLKVKKCIFREISDFLRNSCTVISGAECKIIKGTSQVLHG